MSDYVVRSILARIIETHLQTDDLEAAVAMFTRLTETVSADTRVELLAPAAHEVTP